MVRWWDCGLGFGVSSDAIHSTQAGSIHLRPVVGTHIRRPQRPPAGALTRKCIARRNLVRSIVQRFFENLWKVRGVYFGGYLSALPFSWRSSLGRSFLVLTMRARQNFSP